MLGAKTHNNVGHYAGEHRKNAGKRNSNHAEDAQQRRDHTNSCRSCRALCRAAFPDDAAQQRDQRTGEHNGIADRKKINNICKRKRAYNGCHRNNNIDDEIQALLLLFRCILINKAAVQVMNNKRIRRHQRTTGSRHDRRQDRTNHYSTNDRGNLVHQHDNERISASIRELCAAPHADIDHQPPKKEQRNAKHPLAYCKHDGSLDDGFEIVTHPLTLDYHKNEMPWQAIVDRAKALGYTSHQAGTCGLHVHVNRNAFGETEARQDAVIARILFFFEKNWEELLKFSRRTQYQLDQWAARYGYKDQPKELLDHAKKSAHAGRYTSVNLTNKNTIEFRIFRGTLKYNTLIATLQLLDRICDVALFMSDEELKAMSWTTFVSGCTQPELVQYLKERRLYVNEPIESEAEV